MSRSIGLRIHHITERDCVIAVPHDFRYPDGSLGYLHIHLDENGDSVVSEGVWNQLEQSRTEGICDPGFVVLNEVLNPPTMQLGFSQTPDLRRVVLQHAGEESYVSDTDLRAIAQEFAPKGLKARIYSPPGQG